MNNREHSEATFSGLRWNFINQAVSQVSTFIIGIILMNLLSPSEFGIIAMATVFTGFLVVFSKAGLGASLVQSEQISSIDINTVFWASVGIGLLLTVLIFLCSWPIAFFYSEPRLIPIIQVLSLNFLIIPLGATPSSLLQKEMRFEKLFWVNTISVVVAAIIAIVLAFRGWGVWSLVWHKVLETFFKSIGMVAMERFLPKMEFCNLALRKHLKFGLPYLGSKSLLYWIGNADNLIIGYALGSKQLGYYSRAYSIVTIPARKLGLILSTVLFPSLAKLKSDRLRLVEIFKKMNEVLLFIMVPMMLVVSLAAEPFIVFIAGEKWLPSVYLIQVLSFVAITKVNIQIFHNLLLSQGRSDLDFKLNIFSGIIVIAGFFIGVQYGLKPMVNIYLVMSCISLIIWYFVVARFMKIKIDTLLIELLRYISVAVALFSIWTIFLRNQMPIRMHLVEILSVSVFVAVGWISLLYIINKEATTVNLRLIKKLVLKK